MYKNIFYSRLIKNNNRQIKLNIFKHCLTILFTNFVIFAIKNLGILEINLIKLI